MNKFIIALLLLISPCYAIIEDNFVNTTLNKHIEKPHPKPFIDYSSTKSIPITLNITDEILSEQEVFEGQVLNFKVKKDVFYNGKVIAKKGESATARVETTIDNGMNGIPASLILGDFKIANLDSNKLTMYYEKYGADLSLYVYPLKILLTPMFPLGTATNFIKGGHAHIYPNTNIVIYYHPEWTQIKG